MTYPKASTTGAHERPVEPTLPRDRGAGPRLLGAGRHLPGQHRRARRGRGRRQRVRLLRRPAVRQRAAALRPPAHRLRQGHRPALPDHARPQGRAPVRLGHPRPARRARGDAAQRHQDHRRDPRAGHREVQRGLPRLGDEVHRRVARLRHPAGALGRLRPRLPHLRARLHGVGDLGLQAALRQGLGLRGLPGPARTAGTTRPRCPTTSCGWTTTSTGCARTRRSPSGCGSTERPGRAARWLLVWTTTPWTLPSNLAVMVGDGHRLRRGRVRRHRHAERYLLAEARLAAYARELGDDAARSLARFTGRRPGRPHLHAAVLLLPRPRARVPASCRPSSSPPRTAPGWCTPPAPSARTTRSSPTARASRR